MRGESVNQCPKWPNLPDPIPLEAFFAADGVNPNPAVDPRPALTSADVIVSTDIMTGGNALIYGQEALRAIRDSGASMELNVMNVAIDAGTDDLEKLLALVQVMKGRHDYKG